MAYPAAFTPEPEGGFTIVYRDLGGVSHGASEGEAMVAADALLASWLAHYADEDRPFPRASAPLPGERLIRPGALDLAKIALRREMRRAGVSNRDLADRLGIAENRVRRLVNLDHRSHIGDIEQALRALGREVEVTLETRAMA